jgi:hypothetical protein
LYYQGGPEHITPMDYLCVPGGYFWERTSDLFNSAQELGGL